MGVWYNEALVQSVRSKKVKMIIGSNGGTITNNKK